MRLTEKQIAKYQAVYLATYGEPISKEEALIQGLALLRLVKNITQPENIKYEEENYDEAPRQLQTNERSGRH